MQYKAREPDQDTAVIIKELEPVANGLGFCLIEVDLYRKKGSARVRLVIGSSAGIGTDQLSMVHRAVLPRLELLLEGRDLYVEVSSPGTDRIIKEGAEFRHYYGNSVKCWLKGADNWKQGILRSSDEKKIMLETAEGIQEMNFINIAKARLGNSRSLTGQGR